MTLEEQYYDKGYFVSKLPAPLLAYLWNEVYSTEWVDDKKENIYKQVPSWYISELDHNVGEHGQYRHTFERAIGSEMLHKAPESLLLLSKAVAETPELEYFKRYYQRCETLYIDLWNGSEEIPYHFDTINGADTLILIYLTEQSEWKTDWGGQINLKKQINDVTICEEEVLPLNGTMVVINNTNPLVFHKITALQNNAVNRYTFSFNYRWF